MIVAASLLAVLAPGSGALETLGRAWPSLLRALVVWMGVHARRRPVGRAHPCLSVGLGGRRTGAPPPPSPRRAATPRTLRRVPDVPSLGDLLKVLPAAGLVIGGVIGFFLRAETTRRMLENTALGASLGLLCGTIVSFTIAAFAALGHAA